MATSFGGGGVTTYSAAPMPAVQKNYFKSPTSGNAVTWDDAGVHTDTGIAYDAYSQPAAPVNPQNTWANGVTKQVGDAEKYGQGAYVPPTYADGRINTTDPAFSNFLNNAPSADINAAGNQWNFNAQQTDRDITGTGSTGNAGVGSLYNNISWMPTDTYAGYVAKYNAGKASQDPTWAWGNGGAPMLTEAEYNAQNTRVATDKTTFGGSSPAAEAAQTLRTDAYVAAHPTGAAGTANPGTFEQLQKEMNGSVVTPGATTNPSATDATGTSGTTTTGASGPGNWQVDPNQTVESRISGIINGNNPLLQQARARAEGRMNDRGLRNSSLATTAADSAVYDIAEKIASQDASTYADAAKTNAGALTSWGINQNNNQTQRDLSRNNIAAQRELARATQLYNNLTRQTESSTSIQNWGLSTITNIQGSDLSAEAKTTAIDSVKQFMGDSYQIQGDWHTSAASAIDAIFGGT